MKILALFLPLFGREPLGFQTGKIEMITVRTRNGLMTWRRDDVNGMQIINLMEMVLEK